MASRNALVDIAYPGSYSTGDVNQILGNTISQRGTLLPLVKYGDNSVGPGLPEFINAPVNSLNNMLTPGYFDFMTAPEGSPAQEQGMSQAAQDSFNVSGAVAGGGSLAPRPANSLAQNASGGGGLLSSIYDMATGAMSRLRSPNRDVVASVDKQINERMRKIADDLRNGFISPEQAGIQQRALREQREKFFSHYNQPVRAPEPPQAPPQSAPSTQQASTTGVPAVRPPVQPPDSPPTPPRPPHSTESSTGRTKPLSPARKNEILDELAAGTATGTSRQDKNYIKKLTKQAEGLAESLGIPKEDALRAMNDTIKSGARNTPYAVPAAVAAGATQDFDFNTALQNYGNLVREMDADGDGIPDYLQQTP